MFDALNYRSCLEQLMHILFLAQKYILITLFRLCWRCLTHIINHQHSHKILEHKHQTLKIGL